MGLRINTNVAALNTARILRRSTGALNRSLERLSSGLRINRAAEAFSCASLISEITIRYSSTMLGFTLPRRIW